MQHPRPASLRTTVTFGLFAVLFALAIEAAEDEPGEIDEDQSESATEEGAIEVPVLVEATEIEVQPGHTRFDTEFIRAMPGGEANLADLLRANPAVDFSRESDLSASSATLRPAEISIHGQPFYQNAFLIDGIDTSNDLNPADSGDIWATPSLTRPHGGSSPQGYYVDTSLIKTVVVYDSNVPAEYGGFTGGVVAAELKPYGGENTVSLGYSLRRDEWEEFHVTEDDVSVADYYRAAYTPDYRKSHWSIGLQRGIGDLGLSLSISRRLSTFAQRYDKRYHIDRRETQYLDYEDVIENVLGKVDTEVNGTTVGVSFRHARRRHDGLTSTTYDGRFEKDHDGNGVSVNLERAMGGGRLEVGIGFDRVQDVLDSDSTAFIFHEYVEGSATGTQYEGAFGDSDQSQVRYSVKPKWTLAPRKMGDVEHRIVLGGELQRTRSHYERPEDVVFERYACIRDLRGSQSREGCVDMDGDGVSSLGDEYLAGISNWYAGKVDLTYGAAALHAEDRLELGRWRVNLGVRVDWNDYLGNVDVSPRLSTERDLFGDERSIVVAGVNRYYGRSFFRYQLNDDINGWRDITVFRSNGSVLRVSTFDDRSGRSDLATPYSDELMLGWTQAIGATTARLQFVNREGKDGVSRARYCLDPEDARCRQYDYIYTNEGRSSTQSATVRLTNANPLRVGVTETTFSLSLSYRDSTSNRQDDSGYDEQIDEDLIYYDGGLIRSVDLPAWDYNVPFGTSFFTITHIPAWNLTWSNFVGLRRGGTIARDSGLDCDDDEVDYCEGVYDIFEDFDFDGLVTVDARIEWRPELIAAARGYLRVEVKNLFDDAVDTNSNRNSERRRFTSGRLFWAEVGLRF